VAGERAARTERETEMQTEKERGVGRGVERRLEHLTHINERLLSAFYVAMREQFAAGKFAPRGMTAQKPCRVQQRSTLT